MLSRRMFLAVAGGTAAVTLLAACSGPAAPATSGAPPAAAPAATTGARKTVLFWGRQQFLPASNDYLTESVKLAGQKGGFETHTLSTSEIPSHTHDYTDQTYGGYGQGTPILGQAVATNITGTTSPTGGGGSHNKMQPWSCLTFLIKT